MKGAEKTVQDHQIVQLYWDRAEDAIAQSEQKYGGYCYAIAQNLLGVREDSEECVSDTWLNAWQAMPPQRPARLAAFLGRITRNLALDRWRRTVAAKRGAGQTALLLEELAECLPAPGGAEDWLDERELTALLDRFLAGLAPQTRLIFLRRYWYGCPVRQIAADCGLTESKVKMTLLRTREKLRTVLEKEGIPV